MQLPDGTFPSELVLYVESGLLVVLILVSLFPAARLTKLTGSAPANALGRYFPSEARKVALFGVLGFSLNALLTLGMGFPVLSPNDPGAYLIMGETFAAGQLTNPPAPHFALVPEQVLGQPVYTGKYPPGQGLMLALGFVLGHPGIALWFSSGLLAASMAWCLFGWLPSRWALLGSSLVLLRLAVGSYWNHIYGGGSVAAIGGALLFGGLGRHFLRGRSRARPRSLAAVAVGFSILAISRPWEGFLCALPVLVWLAIWLVREVLHSPGTGLRSAALLAVIGGSTIAFIAYYNYRTTGSPTRFSHQVYEQDRPVAGEFVWQRWLKSEGRMSWYDADVPAAERSGWWRPSLGYFFHRLSTAAYFLIGPVLLLAMVVTLPWLLRARRLQVLACCWLLALAGHAVVQFYMPHYSAPLTAPLYILGLSALRFARLRPPRRFQQARALVLAAAVIQAVSFLLQLPALRRDSYDEAIRQTAINRQLEEMGGEHLVMVMPGEAAVYNFRDLDAPVLWAAELGRESTASLLELFPDRSLWWYRPYSEPNLVPLAREDAPVLHETHPTRVR